MADLELTHIQMFAEEGDPGWYAAQLEDGRRSLPRWRYRRPTKIAKTGSTPEMNRLP